MSFGKFFFNLNSVDVVVGAERYDFLVGSDIVHDAPSDSVNIEVV